MSLTLRHEAPPTAAPRKRWCGRPLGTPTSPAATSTTISICSVSPRLPPGADLRMRGGRRPGRADRLRLQLHRAGGRRVSGHRHLRSPGRPPSFQGKGLARALVCHALRQAQALGEQAVVILGDPPALRPLRLPGAESAGASPWRTASTCPASRQWSWPPAPGKRRRGLPRGLCLCPLTRPRWTLLTPFPRKGKSHYRFSTGIPGDVLPGTRGDSQWIYAMKGHPRPAGRHGFRFSKSMGQNFLIEGWVPRDIAEASGAGPDTGVLEIGPGIGPLTVQLARRGWPR